MAEHRQGLFKARSSFKLQDRTYYYYRLGALQEAGLVTLSQVPYTVKILLEFLLRRFDGSVVNEEHIAALAKWGTKTGARPSLPFWPTRVLLQDFTGVPALVDLASLRQALADLGGHPAKINPEVAVDLVIDHSLQVDKAGSAEALAFNMKREFSRNQERYQFLNWAQKAFANLRIIPPGAGIVHQVNLEYLSPVVHCAACAPGQFEVYPDTLLGADSHTTMINALGVLAWGVGGIEAEAALLGQPSYLSRPEVLGVRLRGSLPPGATATDLALKITEVLRKKKVVGKFVEFYGPGLQGLTLADRATVANMAPEYGATCGFFPLDQEVLNYLLLTGRHPDQVRLIEEYSKLNGLFYHEDSCPQYTENVEIDLSQIQTSLAGPKRPQDLLPLRKMRGEFKKTLSGQAGFGLKGGIGNKDQSALGHGFVAIAAITSCTNTSNPAVMLGAGLLAKKAVQRGLSVPAHVKTSLTPGSRAVKSYLQAAGLLAPLEKLGFAVAGYGCATCIGNSGPLKPGVEQALREEGLLACAVVSGNRNFEGRIHPLIKANYLASPPLVVAYALAGTVDFDFEKEPLGQDQKGRKVYLSDLWPSSAELKAVMEEAVQPEVFAAAYENIFEGNRNWNDLQTEASVLYNWDANSTYIQNPPFFIGLTPQIKKVAPLKNLAVLAKLGDSVTTDHISPAGAIPQDSPAGSYLLEQGLEEKDFNSYGSRRGNHEVLLRGTFANARLRNHLAPQKEGGYTTHLPSGEVVTIYEAARRYQAEGTDLLIMAGQDYGMGSSRDWAAKGPQLLGVKAVLAESFERIHRSNLVMMGLLPLRFRPGDSGESLGLTGKEIFDIEIDDSVQPRGLVKVTATDGGGRIKEFKAVALFENQAEIDYYKHGGILQMVLRQKLAESKE